MPDRETGELSEPVLNWSSLSSAFQVDLWAMTTMVNLRLPGYVRIGG
jgi:hypothetical protein